VSSSSLTDLPDLIPAPEAIRARLAVVLTEADVLRRQLKVSVRAAKEAERLRRQAGEAGRDAQGGAAGAA
jgi:hypothetical protein